jgi:hypothetical protein
VSVQILDILKNSTTIALQFTTVYIAINVLVGFLQKRKYFQLFSIFLVFSACVEIVSTALSYAYMNNLFLVHIYVLGEFYLLTLVFAKIYEDLGNVINFKPLIIVGVLFIVSFTLFVQPVTMFNSYTATLNNVYIILLSLHILQHIFNDDVASSQTFKYLLYFLLLRSGITLVVLLFSNQLLYLPREFASLILFLRKLIFLFTNIYMIYYLYKHKSKYVQAK